MNDPNAGGSSGDRSRESAQEKESFIGQEDRPEVRIDPDRPVAELRVRELTAILGQVTLKTIREKPWKLEKLEKFEKPELKDLKPEKFEKPEFKDLKPEKYEKLEKIEQDPVKHFFEPHWPFDPGQLQGPDPNPWRQVVQVVTGLQQQVSQLANQVAELQKKIGG